MSGKKLKVQDFISIGIYTAIYFLIICLSMLAIRFVIPGFSTVFIPAISALFSGIVYLMLLNRVPKFGAITIMSAVMGIFFLISGHFPMAFVPNFLFGLLADVIQYKTKLPEKIRGLLSYILFSFGLTGPVFPLWFMKNAYIDSLVARGKDAAYIEKVFAPATSVMLYVCIFSIIICAVIGFFIGKGLYEKHFNKNKDYAHG